MNALGLTLLGKHRPRDGVRALWSDSLPCDPALEPGGGGTRGWVVSVIHGDRVGSRSRALAALVHDRGSRNRGASGSSRLD